MRVILTILFVFMTTSAFACDHLSQANRINPTELSDYQKCWLDEHRADKPNGVLGSLFYVKIDGDYVSVPVKELVKRGEDKSVDYITLKINEKIQEDLIEEARTELQRIRSSLSKLYALAIVAGVTEELKLEVISLIEAEEELVNALGDAK